MSEFVLLNAKQTKNNDLTIINTTNIRSVRKNHSGGTMIHFSEDDCIIVSQSFDQVCNLLKFLTTNKECKL